MEMRAVSLSQCLYGPRLTIVLAIQAPLHTPIPHLHDRALLRPLSTLGKPKFSDTGVSFLRRTEYISSYTSKSRFDSVTSRSLIGNTGGNRPKRAPQSIDKESPEYIKAQVEKSFEVAAKNLELKAVQHPSKKNVKLVEAYPLLPDHDGFPDPGGYATIKFTTNPMPPSSTYDTRLESSILMPLAISDAEAERRAQITDAHERDPERNPAPNFSYDYGFYMPDSVQAGRNFKRRFDTLDPGRDDDELYTGTDIDKEPCFRFKRTRAYESQMYGGSQEEKYDDEVVIALHDGTDGIRTKGAYYYPLVQKISIRPQRQKNINLRRGGFGSTQEETAAYDCIEIKVIEEGPEASRMRSKFAVHPYGSDDEEDADGEGEADD